MNVIGNGESSGNVASNVVGLDLGRRNIKLFTGHKYIVLPSILSEWRELKLRDEKKLFEGEFQGKRFFAGVLADEEGEHKRQMLVEDKATSDARILALVSLHQTGMSDFDIVTGVPVSLHDNENKAALVNLLKGTWEIEVEGVKRTLNITRVRVAVEGGGAFWSSPRDGLVRIVDAGSKTVNYITMKNKKYVDRDSGTITRGFDTSKSDDPENFIMSIAGELGKRWEKHDLVFTVGGQAELVAEYLKPYFPSATVLQERKKIMVADGQIDLNMFSNAIGYYSIGRTV